MIMNSIRSIARERADLAHAVTLIDSEVMENVYDEILLTNDYIARPVKEGVDEDDIDFLSVFRDEIEDVDVDDLLEKIGTLPDTKDEEIDNILNKEDDEEISVDDVFGTAETYCDEDDEECYGHEDGCENLHYHDDEEKDDDDEEEDDEEEDDDDEEEEDDDDEDDD